jgi:hypothetical protein
MPNTLFSESNLLLPINISKLNEIKISAKPIFLKIVFFWKTGIHSKNLMIITAERNARENPISGIYLEGDEGKIPPPAREIAENIIVKKLAKKTGWSAGFLSKRRKPKVAKTGTANKETGINLRTVPLTSTPKGPVRSQKENAGLYQNALRSPVKNKIVKNLKSFLLPVPSSISENAKIQAKIK